LVGAAKYARGNHRRESSLMEETSTMLLDTPVAVS